MPRRAMQNRTPGRPQVPAFTAVPRKYRHDGCADEARDSSAEERRRAFIEE